MKVEKGVGERKVAVKNELDNPVSDTALTAAGEREDGETKDMATVAAPPATRTTRTSVGEKTGLVPNNIDETMANTPNPMEAAKKTRLFLGLNGCKVESLETWSCVSLFDCSCIFAAVELVDAPIGKQNMGGRTNSDVIRAR